MVHNIRLFYDELDKPESDHSEKLMIKVIKLQPNLQKNVNRKGIWDFLKKAYGRHNVQFRLFFFKNNTCTLGADLGPVYTSMCTKFDFKSC